jgi:two-component system heavy metal sensor histidine kinase CusS
VQLRNRLFLTLTGTTAAALIASFATVSVLVRREETSDLDRALVAQAHAAAYLAVQRDPVHLSVPDGQGSAPEIYTPMERFAAVYSPGGSVMSATKSFRGAPPPWEVLRVPQRTGRDGHAQNLDVPGHQLRAVVVPIEGRSEWLLYAVSRRSIDEDMTFLQKVFSALLFAAVGVTALLARWLGGILSSDVDAIARVARQVATGDLTARVRDAARGSSETKALGADLDDMIQQLDRLMTAQRTFISHAAHELRSPLATLRGELQLALRRPRSAEEYKASIEEALAEVEALATLAEDLLVLARVQRSRDLTAASSLGETIGDAVRMASGHAREKGVHVDVRLDPGAPCVFGLRADLSRALRNLIDNAVEHSPDGGKVTVSSRADGEKVRVAVEDTGAGVPDTDVPHVFSAFYRGAKDQSGETRGAGLGLAIVREIARGFGGDVSLDASYREGARFVIELRIAPEERMSMGPASVPPP